MSVSKRRRVSAFESPFDEPLVGTGTKILIGLWATFCALFSLALTAGVVFVAWHFAAKYW